MQKRPLSAIISDLKGLVAELDGAQFSINKTGSGAKSAPLSSESYSGPTGHIKMLLDHSFFNTPKSLSAVLDELKKEGYYDRKEVISTALIRMVRQRTISRVPSQDTASREKWNYVERK